MPAGINSFKLNNGGTMLNLFKVKSNDTKTQI